MFTLQYISKADKYCDKWYDYE